jgi:hypothetical protein
MKYICNIGVLYLIAKQYGASRLKYDRYILPHAPLLKRVEHQPVYLRKLVLEDFPRVLQASSVEWLVLVE